LTSADTDMSNSRMRSEGKGKVGINTDSLYLADAGRART
jgi:hypothetical protein